MRNKKKEESVQKRKNDSLDFGVLSAFECLQRRADGENRITKRGPKLFVPIADNGMGLVMSLFAVDFFMAFNGRDVVTMRFGASHPGSGKNRIAAEFLKTDCEYWISIDGDVRFSRQDVDMLLEHDLPLVYGVYAIKSEEGIPCVGTFEKDNKLGYGILIGNGLVEVRRCGGGFFAVKRQVLEALKEESGGPALRYHNNGRVEWDFFRSGVTEGEFSVLEGTDEDGYTKREFVTEDWMFCERVRKLGYPVLLDRRITLSHIGQKEYRVAPEKNFYDS